MVEWVSADELIALLPELKRPLLMIGSGSNLLFTGNFHGTVLHSTVDGIDVIAEQGSQITVRVGSGVKWDDFVAYAVLNGWWGIENLTGIPGEVGAAAVQNIGAYGVEVKDVIDTVQTIRLSDCTRCDFSNAECGYGYRQSIFKNELKGQYAVTHVIFRLSLTPQPKLEYGALEHEVARLGGPALANIRSAVRTIRESKLPDPAVLGNAGSFFMNPVIPAAQFERLKSEFPDVVSFPADNGMVKVSAGWLIDRAGWKGRSIGPAAVYERQALVLVNRGGATGSDIIRLADAIIKDIEEKFGITLKTEVNYI